MQDEENSEPISENEELGEKDEGGARRTKKGREGRTHSRIMPAPTSAPTRETEDVGPVLLKQQGGNLTERLETVLDAFGFGTGKEGLKIKKFVMNYWENTPAVQNPYALFDLLSKVQGFGGALNANMVVGYVFGGPVGTAQYGPPAWAQQTGIQQPAYNPYQQQQQQDRSGSGDEEDEKSLLQEWSKKLMTEMLLGIRMKNMSNAMAPFSMAANPQQQQVIEMRPKVGPDGKFLLDERGFPQYEMIPHTGTGQDFMMMMQQMQRGEQIDPTKLATTFADMFKTGFSAAQQGQVQGAGAPQIEAYQRQAHEAQIGELKAMFSAAEKGFQAEREFMMKQYEIMQPEKQLETLKRWQEAGFLRQGGDDAKTQLRFELYKMQKEEEKEQRQAEAQQKREEALGARQQMHDLIDLGKTALTDALKPVTTAVGDGLRERLSGRGGGTPQSSQSQRPPLDYRQLTPEEVAKTKEKLAEARRFLEEQGAALAAAEAQQQK